MEKFYFLFGVSISEKVFGITYILSRAVQQKPLCANDAKKYAAANISSLKDFRSDATFDEFWHALLRSLPNLISVSPHFL